MVGTADAQIANSGLIEGGNFGILSGAVQLPGDTAPVLRAVGTDIVNSGTIVGQNNDAIRLVGGGTVVNSGISNGQNFVQADGVNMFADEGQDPATYVSSVTNSAEGQIIGVRAGVALSSGGAVDNAGAIDGNSMGVLIQNGEAPLTAAITNSGTITGSAGSGIAGFGNLDGFAVANSGAITGRSEEHTSELQSLMRLSYAVFCWKKKKHICNSYTD